MIQSKPETVQLLMQDQGYKVSSRYSAVPTQALLQRILDAGYTVADISTAVPRNKDRIGFQKHLIRLRHPNMLPTLGGSVAELIIINSYDKSSSIRIMLGVYRFACANGLITGTSFINYRIRHVGDPLTRAVDSLNSAQLLVPKLNEQIRLFIATPLNAKQQIDFATEVAMELLKGKSKISEFEPTHLLGVRRCADKGNDLWSILNRIQENALQGRLTYTVKATDHRGYTSYHRRRLRPVRAIDKQTAINQLVWNTAEKIAA